ncbi:MAG: MFS transporter [Candidatus Omnitrophica bacterium]|nr:MFS transporter [Candidatus Omnitrophota bacterium]
MTAKRSPLALIFLTVFIDLVGFGIVIPVLPLYAERFGMSPLGIGVLLAIYSAMQALGAPWLGRLSDRVGRRPVLLLSLLGTAAGFLLMGLAKTLPLLFLGRIIDGITGGNISTAQAYIADVTPPEERSRGMGLIGAAFGLGFIFGPAIGGVMGHFSLAAPLLFAAGLSAANAVAVYFLLPESLTAERRGQARQRSPIAAIFRQPHGRTLALAIGAYFVTTMAFSLLTATYPLFTERRFGYGAAQNGYLFAAQGILSAVIQGGLLGWLVRRCGDKRLAMAGCALLAASMFGLPTSAAAVALFGWTAGLASGHGLVAAPLNSLASQSVDAASQGRVLGVMQSAASLARIVGPVLGGWLLSYDAAHPALSFGRTPYWTSGLVTLIALALVAIL